MKNYTKQQWKDMLDKIESLEDIPNDLHDLIQDVIASGNNSEFIGIFDNDIFSTRDQMESSTQITVYYDSNHHYPAFNFESYGSINTGGECRNFNMGDDEEHTETTIYIPFFEVKGYNSLDSKQRNFVDQKIKYNKHVQDKESKMRYDFTFDPSYKVKKYWDDYANDIGCFINYRKETAN